jgi:hypothetical protein
MLALVSRLDVFHHRRNQQDVEDDGNAQPHQPIADELRRSLAIEGGSAQPSRNEEEGSQPEQEADRDEDPTLTSVIES